MNSPLGEYVGNTLEVIESIKCLKNEIEKEKKKKKMSQRSL
mgnify:CR=1 FL=1